jgi:hypothetical protein
MFSFFRRKEKAPSSTHDFASLINRRAEDFRAFYTERFGQLLNYQYKSLYLIDTILNETRASAAAIERKQWLATHAGSYLYRVASLRVQNFQFLWYHPLDQPMLVVNTPDYRISLLAQQAVQQRLDTPLEPTIFKLYTNFEQALLQAKPGDDLLFV